MLHVCFWCLELCIYLFDCLLYAPWAQLRRGPQKPHYYNSLKTSYINVCYSSKTEMTCPHTHLFSPTPRPALWCATISPQKQVLLKNSLLANWKDLYYALSLFSKAYTKKPLYKGMIQHWQHSSCTATAVITAKNDHTENALSSSDIISQLSLHQTSRIRRSYLPCSQFLLSPLPFPHCYCTTSMDF